jgi:hypothetical protein
MRRISFLLSLATLCATVATAQPSFSGPVPVPPADARPDVMRRDYLARVHETLEWYQNAITP